MIFPSKNTLFALGAILALSFFSISQVNAADTYHRSDINHDGNINLFDYSILIMDLFEKTTNYPTDLDGNGTVNLLDYATFIYDLQHPDETIPTPQPTPSPQPSPSPEVTTINKKVLMIGFDPTENGQSFANTYFSNAMNGRTAEQTEDDVFRETAAAFDRLSNGTISFTLAKKIRLTTSPTYPDGFKFSLADYSKCVWGSAGFDPDFCEQRKSQFDYVKWITDEKICETAAEAGADEIWILSLPYILQWENFMVGPNPGFNVNGANYTVPSCTKHIIAVNPTYDRPNMILHDIGHRVEATMEYLTQNWRPEDRSQHWRNFSRFGTPVGSAPLTCGNTHFPPNTNTGYDTGNTSTATHSCDDWQNFPTYTSNKTTSNCSAWGCTDSGWQEYWLGRLPRTSGQVQMTSATGKPFTFPKNWWKLLLYPDEAIAFYQTIQ